MASSILSTKSFRIGVTAAALAGLVAGLVTWVQARRERQGDRDDLNRRSRLVAERFAPTALEALKLSDVEAKERLSSDIGASGRLLGLCVWRADGRLVAAPPGIQDSDTPISPIVTECAGTGKERIQILETEQGPIHVLAWPVLGDRGVAMGVVTVLHDASYLVTRDDVRLAWGAFWILSSTLLVFVLVVGLTWVMFERPLHHLADWMRRLRDGSDGGPPPRNLPVVRLIAESDRLAESLRKARSIERPQVQGGTPERQAWTCESLRAHTLECLDSAPLVVVSNREPYIHDVKDARTRVIVPASGLVTALDPILRACGGLWVAHGGGEADRQNCDARGRLLVPPDDPCYTLRRVWLTTEEEAGYYYGFANEGIWPLCHLAHERPVFRRSDWEHYLAANRKFADAVLDEIGGDRAFVLVQDYHLALVPRMLRLRNPKLRIGLFWHIPWPNPEAFRICPWRVEILEGMLGADLIGFHLQQHCNNLLDTIDRMVEARLDWDHFAATWRGHATAVAPFPISVQSWSERGVPTGEDLSSEVEQLRAKHQIQGVQVIVGVDRLDYTKGLFERLRAVDLFFASNPDARERVVFVQLAAPSRTHLPRYRELASTIEKEVDEINWRWKTERWRPIVLLVAHHDARAVYAFMKMASVCIVSSLHDGMNLVAKEYVAAKDDGEGVLVLSEFAGAARELADALIVNPYDTEEFAKAIRRAVEMDAAERRARMLRMHRLVLEKNIYRWAADFLRCLSEAGAVGGQPVGLAPPGSELLSSR